MRITSLGHSCLLVEGGDHGGRTITLFPPAAVSTNGVEAPLVGAVDVPFYAPRLVAHGEAVAARERRPLRRWWKKTVRRRWFEASRQRGAATSFTDDSATDAPGRASA